MLTIAINNCSLICHGLLVRSPWLLSSQRDCTADPWQEIFYDIVVNEVLELISEGSSEDEENTLVLNDVLKKR